MDRLTIKIGVKSPYIQKELGELLVWEFDWDAFWTLSCGGNLGMSTARRPQGRQRDYKSHLVLEFFGILKDKDFWATWL